MMKDLCLLAAMAMASFGQTFSYLPCNPKRCASGGKFPANSLCEVLGEIPLATLIAPSTGCSYRDSNFGFDLRIMTPVGYRHSYAMPSAFSATGKYLSIFAAAGGHYILDRASATILPGKRSYSVGGYVSWDGVDDDYFYYLYGPQIRRHRVSLNQSEIYIDYSGAPYYLLSLKTGGMGDTTSDNWFSFYDKDRKVICAVKLDTKQTYCSNYVNDSPDLGWGEGGAQGAFVAKGVDSLTGKRYVIMTDAPALGLWSINEPGVKLDFVTRGPELSGNGDGICQLGEDCLGNEHLDFSSDASGLQQLVEDGSSMGTTPGLSVVMFHLGKEKQMAVPASKGGGKTEVFFLHPTQSIWPAKHFACAKASPWCVTSLYPNTARADDNLNTPFTPTSYRGEVIMFRAGHVQRLAAHRSVRFVSDSYYGTPRATISGDAKYVAWDSNFGYPGAGKTRVVVVDTQKCICE